MDRFSWRMILVLVTWVLADSTAFGQHFLDGAGHTVLLRAPESETEDDPTDLDAVVRRLKKAEAELKELREAQEESDDSEEKDSEKEEKKDEEDPLEMFGKWRYGLDIETRDKAFRFHIGGRAHFDGTWFSADDDVEEGPGGTGPFEDAVYFRRGRLKIDGEMYENISWAAQFDFFSGFEVDDEVFHTPVPTDLWLTITDVPGVGNIRFGNQKDPFGFEHMTSSRWLNFMERSLLYDAFQERRRNGFAPGVQIYDADECELSTWAFGVFKNITNSFAYGTGDGEYQVTGRVTRLLYYECEGRSLMHVGLAGSFSDADDDEARYRVRPSLRSGPGPENPLLADTGTFIADNQSRLGAELAIVEGPWTVVSELQGSWVGGAVFPTDPLAARMDRGVPFYWGYYVEALYFLTGEHRAYNRKSAVFDRVIPRDNLEFECGRVKNCGAWQIGARYSYVDLDDEGLDGAVLHDVTLGLNWFLNPNTKFQWNYMVAHRNAVTPDNSGFVHGFGTRLAWDF